MSSGEAIGDHDGRKPGSSLMTVGAVTAQQQCGLNALSNVQAKMPRPPEMAERGTAQGRRTFSSDHANTQILAHQRLIRKTHKANELFIELDMMPL